jgi:hypothetical protein
MMETAVKKTASKKDNREILLLAFLVLLSGLAIGLVSYKANRTVLIDKPDIKLAAVGITIQDVDITNTNVQQTSIEIEPKKQISKNPRIINSQTFILPTFVLNYAAGDNGSLSGSTTQRVSYGMDGIAITAIPDFGYHFTNWSDGFDNNPRRDLTIMATTTVDANFAINTYTLNYEGGSGGYLIGTTTQAVIHGGSGSAVSAVPNLDNKFVNWSDGSTNNPRTDTVVESNMSVKANFIFVYIGGPTRVENSEVITDEELPPEESPPDDLPPPGLF